MNQMHIDKVPNPIFVFKKTYLQEQFLYTSLLSLIVTVGCVCPFSKRDQQ